MITGLPVLLKSAIWIVFPLISLRLTSGSAACMEMQKQKDSTIKITRFIIVLIFFQNSNSAAKVQ
jgi:hypothetical protein